MCILPQQPSDKRPDIGLCPAPGDRAWRALWAWLLSPIEDDATQPDTEVEVEESGGQGENDGN